MDRFAEIGLQPGDQCLSSLGIVFGDNYSAVVLIASSK